MGLFDKILEALDLKKKPTAAPVTKISTPIPRTTATQKDSRPITMPSVIPSTKPVTQAIPEVDVVTKLEKLAKAYPGKLNWKTSIADLLQLLGIDNSLANRKELAKELGCPPEKISGDYSEMNMWLHKTVLKKIAENGGNIPKELLD